MLLQVDIDSTLYDADKLFKQVAEEEFGFKWVTKSNKWLSPEDLGVDLQTLLRMFRKSHSREYVEQQKPYPYAVEVLTGLVEDFPEIEVAYVSDRNEQQSKALSDWLDANGFLQEDTFVAATKDKRHWMRERNPEVVIDDRVRTMLMARFELGSYVVSLEHNHNANLRGEAEHIYIVKDWREIDTVLRETIIPKLYEKSLSKMTEKRYARV